MVDDARWDRFEARRERLARHRARASATRVRVDGESITAAQALARPDQTLEAVARAGFSLEAAPEAAAHALDAATIEAELKYQGYLKRDEATQAKTAALESRAIPRAFEYRGIPGLSREVVERLTPERPETVGQASRVPGMTPAAAAIVAARVSRWREPAATTLPTIG
jgi:tRNA uridine 5-carboxymethylaminomethyl modification enzyme